MANILILDDEQSSRTRLFEALSALDQHKLFTAANPIAWARCVEELAGAIHVLIMDSSFLAAPAPELLDLFREACPQARILLLTHSIRYSAHTRLPVLRKPFTDEDLVDQVKRLLRPAKPARRRTADNQERERDCA